MLDAYIFWKHKFMGNIGPPRTMMIQQFVFSGENKQKYTAQALELMVAEFFLISCAQLSYKHVFIE